jgi:hypothetical protein
LLRHCTIILHSQGSGKKPITVHCPADIWEDSSSIYYDDWIMGILFKDPNTPTAQMMLFQHKKSTGTLN